MVAIVLIMGFAMIYRTNVRRGRASRDAFLTEASQSGGEASGCVGEVPGTL
ncbi:hypothetical protein RB2501_01121 [Robiginitalea biformata HTCC2501]|uniref:Uncharacterized protein n=1 Tax=Robiginitalea biformata (strain ATCC BAA-864 / DSM 15991 / KCTC 12146 / HTCC2501) TaxID=313596 RepID=A4CP17_ROBBH|nr:hypothetical protein RB2501_01121 [Robiginitalea biformata HTCC2501]